MVECIVPGFKRLFLPMCVLLFLILACGYAAAAPCVDTPALLDFIEHWRDGRVSMHALMGYIGQWKSGEDCGPAKTCSDGTLNSSCSTANPMLYCNDGNLIFEEGRCGADAGKCCQSNKNTAPYATFLAVNVPYSEDCSNAPAYFDLETIGWWWIDNTFSERPGIAAVGGGYPTRVVCREQSFYVMPEDWEERSNHGVRYKAGACIFVPWSDTDPSLGDKQQQVAVLDWNYSADSFCSFNGTSVEPVGLQ